MGIIRCAFRNGIELPLLFMLTVSCACVYAGSFADSRDGEQTFLKNGYSFNV